MDHMAARVYLSFAAIVSLLASATLSAQQKAVPVAVPAHPSRHVIDVVVEDKSGQPVAGLAEQDFTLLEGATPLPIASFTAVQHGTTPAEVLLVIDAVNTPTVDVGYQRDQIEKFLRSSEGQLAHLTSFAVVSDDGVTLYNHETKDGNALADALNHQEIGLRQINRSGGFYGAADRLTICLKAMHNIAAYEANRPGRKLVVWISPGWPLLSGPGIDLDDKEEKQIYDEIVAFSAELQAAQVTLYDVNSWGATEPIGRSLYYEDFLKPVTKPTQAQAGNLGLQVLALQSGGLALNTNDVPSMLQRCLRDAGDYYEISFDPAPAQKPGEFHPVQLRLAKPGLTVRTRQGYYSQPAAAK
jgi:VWFA-related protein